MKKIYVPGEQSEETICLEEVPLKSLILVKKRGSIVGIINYCYEAKGWKVITPVISLIINEVKYFTSQEELIREGIKEGYSFYIE
ncbi:MAG: hypothetical protein GY841_14190 [FCB group bacterium]|nr:hypothetical protein [FCB group bacterium]